MQTVLKLTCVVADGLAIKWWARDQAVLKVNGGKVSGGDSDCLKIEVGIQTVLKLTCWDPVNRKLNCGHPDSLKIDLRGSRMSYN